MLTTDQNKISMSKIYPILGMLLFLIGLITNYLYFNTLDPTKNGELNGPLVEQLKKFPPLLILAFPMIIAPIMEEFAFRGWLKLTNRRKIISLVLIVIYVHSVSNSLLLSAFILILLFLFLFKIKPYFFHLNILSTSLLFSLTHVHNFNDPMITLASLTQLFGVGLILSYVVYRFGILYAIILHAVNNTIAFLPLIVVSNTAEPIVFENESYTATLKPVSLFDFKESNTYDYNDSISITNSLTEIAVELAPFKSDLIYKSSTLNLANFNLKVLPKSNKTINSNTLFEDYLRVSKISLDTIYEPAYTLEQITNFQYQPSSEPTYKTKLFSLVRLIRAKYDIPLWIPSHLKDSIYTIDISTIRMSSFDDFRSYLEQNQGLRILDPVQIQLQVVRFK
jgi:membrane protease YdiL (CAAX protease family)